MSRRKPGLGRGLDALLSTANPVSPESLDSAEPLTLASELQKIPVDLIQQGRYQPRTHIDPDALEELANSIRVQGVIQPIVIRPLDEELFEIIAGERRWRAAKMAGLTEIPAVISDISDREAAAVALIENIQRANLNPLEEAKALQRLIAEFGLTHQQVADSIGRSRAAVSNLLRLLDLNDDVKQLVEQGSMEMGHARALLPLDDEVQLAAAEQVVNKKLTVRDTEKLVKQIQEPDIPQLAKFSPPPEITQLETRLTSTLGAKVNVSYNDKGKGKLVINYDNLDQLQQILGHIERG